MSEKKHILVTGGAGYIGALLVGELLRLNYRVTVVDDLLYGGEGLLGYLAHPDFHFEKGNVWEARTLLSAAPKGWQPPEAILHLAGIVGFPACQSVGRQVAWRYNVESTQRVLEQAERMKVPRLIFASTYSVYAPTAEGELVTEESRINPQSLYTETKAAAERYLLGQAKTSACAPVIFRLADAYGLSPRPRFDLLLNQFVLEAYTRRELLIYQRGYSRSYIHVRDAVRGLLLGITVPEERVRGQVFNLGGGNYTKDEIVTLIRKRLPEIMVQYKDMTFGGDMRDLSVSYDKIKTALGFEPQFSADDGVREVLHALRAGLVGVARSQEQRYRNAWFIVQ